MFPKENRLSTAGFTRVKREGRMVSSASFGGLVVGQKEKGAIKVGIVVSTKISKSAVVRNRVKRRMRKGIVPWLSGAGGYDVVFLVKKAAITVQDEKLQLELDNFFKKVLNK